MKRKALSLVLALAMLLSLMPVFQLPARAASASDMDALTALGIDTNKAPEGYNPYSTDNPYGKNTIEISPVYELYKVGLANGITYPAAYSTASTLQNGETTAEHSSAPQSNSLQSTLYGSEAWGKSASAIIAGGADQEISNGQTTVTGDYTLISSGTVSNTAASDISANGYLKGAKNASTSLDNGFQYAMSAVAAGNFDENKGGLQAQTVMVYTTDYSNHGGLYLRFGNAATGTYGTDAKELLTTATKIGNPDLTFVDTTVNPAVTTKVENFADHPYQLQNYLQVATGDWNGDGMDEVAVYIPEENNSRIAVYALQLTSGDDRSKAFMDPANWSLVWTYYLREDDVVSNMVSFVSGDVNRDGTDDLAGTWGYYYGPTQNKGSKAVVMFGGKGTTMLKSSQEFDLTYGSSNIVRASFVFGDMAGAKSAGADAKVLVLCGQSDADLKDGNTQTRYVALYDWNGKAFTANISQNFDLFEKKDGAYIWGAMKYRSADKLYSLPLCPANAAMISQGVSGGGDLLYFDSLLIEYTDKGLNIKEAWDNSAAMQQNTGDCVEYVEYGAVAGDLTGTTGAGALFTMTQTLSTYSENLTATYHVTGTHQEPVYARAFYYKNWFYKLFNIKTWYTYVSGYATVADSKPVTVGYTQLTMGKAYMVAVGSDLDEQEKPVPVIRRTQEDFSTNICLANTDQDSSYMSYGGRHYYTYTDPQVLTVLASPPYFSDLAYRDDLSGNYSNSSTSYSKTEGSGSGATASATIKVGAYVSYEHDFEILGVKVASVEAEAVVTASFTFDWEKTSTLEQTVTYNAGIGEDTVAFYSIPMEIYEYTSYVADGQGGYREVRTTVNIPHEAAVRQLSLAEYEFIAKDYAVLPKIADNVLTHEIGDPSTYPASTAGYNVIAQYSGTPAAVGFTGASGGAAISQEIAMSTETRSAFTGSAGIEAKAGAGPGDFKVGVIAGVEAGGGYVKISTSGSSFSGDMQNMPVEAQPYGYGMNWKIFCYRYSNGAMTFPVVSYLVSEARNPAPLPNDFSQDMANTTSKAIALNWSYDRNIAGFKIYRYYEFPEGSGSYEVAFVPFTAGHRESDTGPFQFSYTDTGLSPYTEYKYQIKTVRGTNPKESIYSEPMVCRTKTTVGYPLISLDGLNASGVLPIYPDDSSSVTVRVDNPEKYSGLNYQWQKMENGAWVNLSGKTGDSLTISNAGAVDNGSYRCRVNTIYYDTGAAQNYYISAYSATFTTAYAKRTSIGNLTARDIIKGTTRGLQADIELYSANVGHSVAPTGNVTFTVKGTDYEYSKTFGLDQQPAKQFADKVYKEYSTASLTIPSLPDGVYSVEAYYSGSRVFKDNEIPTTALVVVGNGQAYQMTLSAQEAGDAKTKFTYGEVIFPSLVTIGKDVDGKVTSTPVTGATYQLFADGASTGTAFTPGSAAPDVGSYTLKGYHGSVDALFSQDFTVTQKPIIVAVENKSEVYAGTVSANPPVITCSDLSTDALAALKLSYTAANTAGNLVVLNDSTDPGNYRVTACTGSETPLKLYNNYSVTYVSGSYTIVGSTHWLTAVAQDYTADGATRPVGTVGISNQTVNKVKYTAASTVLLYATPKDGYEVDTWTAKFADNTTSTQAGGSTFVLLTQAQDVTVTVTFTPARIKLMTIADPGKGGAITCNDSLFSSGAFVGYGAEYQFTATPNEGYHFSTWKIIAGGITTTNKGTAAQDGSNWLTVTVGTASTAVYALFERDAYTLSLSGDITASYLFDDDGVSSTPPIKKTISSGTALPGDTQITAEPKTGYSAKAGAFFTLNGVATDQAAKLLFPLTGNTTVSLETVRNSYAVTVGATNGAVTTRVNGTPTMAEQLTAVAGGSALSFTARADRGYVFDHWNVNGTNVAGNNPTLTIAELGETTTVEAVFTANTAYTATAVVSNPARGSMSYTLHDIYGEPVGLPNTAMPAGGITVYRGEAITFTAQIVAGSMMEQWKVNEENFYTTQKTHTIDTVSGNIAVTAYLKAASSYAVYFDVIGDGTLEGTVDGQNMVSGGLQYGGSEVKFGVTPAADQMLDHWTITVGDPATTENTAALDGNGAVILDPTYTINPLRQNLTVRAYFTALVTNPVTLSTDESKGVSKVTHVTPITAADDGTRSSTTEMVRSGGTVKLTFTPASGYGVSVDELKTLVKGLVNAEASVAAAVQNGVCTVTIGNLTQALDLSTADIFYAVKNVVMGSMLNGNVTATPAAAKEGETVTLVVAPNAGYRLATLTLEPSTVVLTPAVSASTLRYTFTMPDSEVTVKAAFEQIPVTPGGGGGGAIIPPQTIPAGSGDNTMPVNVTVSNHVATLNLDEAALQTLNTYSGTVSFDFTSLHGVTSASFPADVFDALSDAPQISGLTVALPDADLTFDEAALAAISTASSGNITLSAAMLDAKTLTDAQKALVGDRPVLDLTLTAGGKQVSDFGAGTVQVDVPYTLKPGEDPDTVVVWYLNDKNILECVTGQYHAATKTVTFRTQHFSKYVIGQVPFRDVNRTAWYFDSVSFAFANGLFDGTDTSTFTPDAPMTRAMLVAVLWRMEGEPAAQKASSFSDVTAGQWYEKAVAWAAESGIVSGYGNGRFGSNDPITREQMAVILMSYAKFKGYDVSATTDLTKFTDSTRISSWATAAMQWANARGLVSGTGTNTLAPKGDATRAQVAAILMRFVENIAQ